MDKQKIEQAAQEIKKRGKGVALTGAGISAESGISTYRDPGGLWDTYREGAGGGMLGVLAANPDQAGEILGDFFGRLKASQPNPGHTTLARMEEAGYLFAVITQNVDGLHRFSGSKTVYEMHGNIYRLRCMTCGKKTDYARDAYFAMAEGLVGKIQQFTLHEIAKHLPVCACRGPMRPDFVGFGEPVQDLDAAAFAAKKASWMLVVGTSGMVHPAASLPGLAKQHGALLIEVNTKESDITHQMDIFLKGMGGEILPELFSALENS